MGVCVCVCVRSRAYACGVGPTAGSCNCDNTLRVQCDMNMLAIRRNIMGSSHPTG